MKKFLLLIIIGITTNKLQAQVVPNPVLVTKDYDIVSFESDSTLFINRTEYSYSFEDSTFYFIWQNKQVFPYKVEHLSKDSLSLIPQSKVCKYLFQNRHQNEKVLLINPNSIFKDRIKFDYLIFELVHGYRPGAKRIKFQIENNGRIYLNEKYKGILSENQMETLVDLLEYSCLDWVKVDNHPNIDSDKFFIKIKYNDKIMDLKGFIPNYWNAPFVSLISFLSTLNEEIEFSEITNTELPFRYKE